MEHKLVRPDGTAKAEVGIKHCHHRNIPLSAIMVDPKLGVPQKLTEMAFVGCIKESCALWDAAEKKCGDLVAAEAQKKSAEATFMLAEKFAEYIGLKRLTEAAE